MIQEPITNWKGIPYYPISQFYKNNFGEKVYKVPVTVAQTCPNREGLVNMKTCIFCDEWGSAAYPEKSHIELYKQIESTKKHIASRFKCKKFLVYFQAYTSTYSKVSQLADCFSVANEFDDVCGFVVGTRPDCISDALFDLWNKYSEQKFLAVELGVQTFDDQQLKWMERGHDSKRSIKAIERIKKKCPKVDVGIHLMFGLQGETRQQIVDTAKLVSTLGIDNVKLHNLHVLKNTPLEEYYMKNEFTPIEREEYAERVRLFLIHLSPDIAVHRVAAVASRHDELVAPYWAASKLDNYQYIIDNMRKNDDYQGKLF